MAENNLTDGDDKPTNSFANFLKVIRTQADSNTHTNRNCIVDRIYIALKLHDENTDDKILNDEYIKVELSRYRAASANELRHLKFATIAFIALIISFIAKGANVSFGTINFSEIHLFRDLFVFIFVFSMWKISLCRILAFSHMAIITHYFRDTYAANEVELRIAAFVGHDFEQIESDAFSHTVLTPKGKLAVKWPRLIDDVFMTLMRIAQDIAVFCIALYNIYDPPIHWLASSLLFILTLLVVTSTYFKIGGYLIMPDTIATAAPEGLESDTRPPSP